MSTVEGKRRFLFRDAHKICKCTLLAECRMNVKTHGTYTYTGLYKVNVLGTGQG